jgi:CPA1 family monovalent cation:H+ antiporter
MEGSILSLEVFGVILIFIAAIAGFFFRKRRVPYTVGLVIAGVSIALIFPGIFETISGEILDNATLTQIIMGILVPPLIFEAAFHLHWDDLRRDLTTIMTFAIPGVIITMLIVGGFIWQATALGLTSALVFGALIAATDPVAVVALFRSLGLPKRIQVLLEGESLFNDGTAIVIFTIMLELASQVAKGHTLEIDGAFVLAFLSEFLTVAGGGMIAGLTAGVIATYLISRIDDYLLEVTFTLAAAYGSYVLAEQFHLSGVLAVVASGMLLGNMGPRGMSPTTRNSLFNFWELAAFLANSFVFMLIGLQFNPQVIADNAIPITAAIIAVLVARGLVIYSFATVRRIDTKIKHVMFVGGLRGAISLALALSLSGGLLGTEAALSSADTDVIQAMTIGVVLFTIIIQGFSMEPLVKKLGLGERSEVEIEYQRRQARAVGAQHAYDRVHQMHREGLIARHAWSLLELPLKRQIESRSAAVRDILSGDRSVEVTSLNNAYREALNTQRSTYFELFSNGVIGQEVFQQLVGEVDSALENDEINYADLLRLRDKDQPPLTKMISAVVSNEDLEDTLFTLNIMNIPTTRLESQNGPDGSPATTLLMGVEEEQVDEVVHAILACCKVQVEDNSGFLSFLNNSAVHKHENHLMNIYVFDIEHYEEI